MHACVYRAEMRPSWVRLTMLNWDQSISILSARFTCAVPFNNRKGVSGGAVFFERSLVRSLSRQQQALSLSSCEAELYGLQSVCQESVAFGRLVHRLLFALHEIDEPEEVVIWLERFKLRIATCEVHGRATTFTTHWNKIALVTRADERRFVEIETQKWCWKSSRSFH